MKLKSLRIALADAEPASLDQLVNAVVQVGHEVLLSASCASALLKHVEIDTADLLIADVNVMRSGGLHSLARVLERHDTPVIVTSDNSADEAIELAHACRPLAHLVKPIRPDELRVAIAVASQRFEELRTLRAEASSLSQALESRKVIERAKGIMMRQHQLDEATAFLRLQRMARDQRISLIEISKAVILTESSYS